MTWRNANFYTVSYYTTAFFKQYAMNPCKLLTLVSQLRCHKFYSIIWVISNRLNFTTYNYVDHSVQIRQIYIFSFSSKQVVRNFLSAVQRTLIKVSLGKQRGFLHLERSWASLKPHFGLKNNVCCIVTETSCLKFWFSR